MRRATIVIIAALAGVVAFADSADARRRASVGAVLGVASGPLRMVMGAAGVRVGTASRHRGKAVASRHRGKVVAARRQGGRIAAAPSGERRGGPVGRPGAGWTGPLFWPHAYDDLVTYTLWPSEGGERFLSRGYGDIVDAMFVSAPIVAEDDDGRKRQASGEQDRDASKSIADLCVSRLTADGADRSNDDSIAHATIARIEETIQPEEAQRGALGEFRAALVAAISEIRATCPAANASLAPPERIDAMARRVWAVLQAATALRAPTDTFYNALNDEQKARLNGDASSAMRACLEYAQATVWPASQIERSLALSPEQRPAFEALRETSTKMSQMLMGSCPREAALTPAARLIAAENRLNSVLYAVRIVAPAINTFYDSLSNEQKTRLKALGQPRQASRSARAAASGGGGR